jgi:hypothetical protein
LIPLSRDTKSIECTHHYLAQLPAIFLKCGHERCRKALSCLQRVLILTRNISQFEVCRESLNCLQNVLVRIRKNVTWRVMWGAQPFETCSGHDQMNLHVRARGQVLGLMLSCTQSIHRDRHMRAHIGREQGHD